MKMIPAEDMTNLLGNLKDMLQRLQLNNEAWQTFNAIAERQLGNNIKKITRNDMIEEIAIIWNIEDVQSIRPDLTHKQASIVLQQLKEVHDASIGINWDTIEVVADNLFPMHINSTGEASYD